MFPTTTTKAQNRPGSASVASPVPAMRGVGTEIAVEASKQAARVIPYLIVGGIVVYGLYRYSNRFVKLKENTRYPVANVTLAQAETKANAIRHYEDFQDVSNNLAGLNYNGFVRVYNAFGFEETPPGLLTSLFCPPCLLFGLGGDNIDMIAWLRSKFTSYEIEELSFLFNGQFF